MNLNAGNRNSLTVKLNAAQQSLNRGDRMAAVNQLNAFINEVQALEQSGRLAASTGDALIAEARTIVAAL